MTAHVLPLLVLVLGSGGRALDPFDAAVQQADVQSDILRSPPPTPPKIHWHKLRQHKQMQRHRFATEGGGDGTEAEDLDLSMPDEAVLALERELTIPESSEERVMALSVLPTDEPRLPYFENPRINVDDDLHPQLREKQHYAPLPERDFSAYDDEPLAFYPAKLNSRIFGTAPISDTARCYSCMSKFYEAVWPVLSSVYKRPRNFTDRCNDDQFESRSVPVVHCSTICVQMWEEPAVAGVRIRGHIRGCLDDILHHGFNQSIVTWYRWLHRDSCHKYRKRDLFQLPSDQTDDSYVHVCTCYADNCNRATRVAAGGNSLIGAVTTAVVVGLFILPRL